MFKMMEEYNWDSFAVVTSLYPGYDTFVEYVRSFADTSYFLWELQDVLSFDMSADGLNDLRARRLLQQVDLRLVTHTHTHTHTHSLSPILSHTHTHTHQGPEVLKETSPG